MRSNMLIQDFVLYILFKKYNNSQLKNYPINYLQSSLCNSIFNVDKNKLDFYKLYNFMTQEKDFKVPKFSSFRESTVL